jgi:tRNA uridine 5-carboxymethylaminomethyl modification enzyme
MLGADLGDSITLSQLSIRQGVGKDVVYSLLPEATRKEIRISDLDTALADSLYKGYIEKQDLATERVNHHDSLRVPADFSFSALGGLSTEMVERLERARPLNFAQVRKVIGLTPTAISTVLVHLTAQNSQKT